MSAIVPTQFAANHWEVLSTEDANALGVALSLAEYHGDETARLQVARGILPTVIGDWYGVEITRGEPAGKVVQSHDTEDPPLYWSHPLHASQYSTWAVRFHPRRGDTVSWPNTQHLFLRTVREATPPAVADASQTHYNELPNIMPDVPSIADAVAAVDLLQRRALAGAAIASTAIVATSAAVIALAVAWIRR